MKAEILEPTGPWITVPIGSAGVEVTRVVVSGGLVCSVVAVAAVVVAVVVVAVAVAVVVVAVVAAVGSGVVVPVVGVAVTGTAVDVVDVGSATRAACPVTRLKGVTGGEESNPH